MNENITAPQRETLIIGRGQIHPAPAAAARGMKELCSGDDKKA